MKLSYTVATPETGDTTMLAMRGTLDESFRLLSALGYHGAELMLRDPVALNADEIRRSARACGLAIPAVSTGQIRIEDGLSLSHGDAGERRRAITRMQQVIDFARELGAQVNIGTMRGRLPAGEERSSAREAAFDSLRELAEFAGARGVVLAIEPQNRFIINWLNTVSDTMEWIERFNAPNLTLMFDVYHALLEEPSIYASLIRAFPRLSLVQVSDSNRLPPGQGQIEFGHVIRVLKALGYQGFVSVETQQLPDSRKAAEAAARVLLPLINEP